MKQNIFTIVCFCVILISCKKDETPTNQSPTIDTLTVAYYKCDEESGSTLTDGSSRKNDAYFTGTRSSAGKSGNCIALNGSSQYVSIPSLFPLEFKVGQSFTVEAFVKTSNPGPIFCKDFQCSGGNKLKLGIVILRLYPAGSLNALLYTDPGASIDLRGTKLVGDGEWHNVALVVDAENKEVRLFVDGQLDVKTSYNGESFENDAVMQLGYACKQRTYFQGLIDEIKISMTARY